VRRTIAQRDLRNQNAQIMAEVEAGASFVVTRNGEPIAELRPLERGRRHFVPRAEIARLAAEGPHIDATAFRRDLDQAADQSLSGDRGPGRYLGPH
jgi:prevent-host-death family protein